MSFFVSCWPKEKSVHNTQQKQVFDPTLGWSNKSLNRAISREGSRVSTRHSLIGYFWWMTEESLWDKKKVKSQPYPWAASFYFPYCVTHVYFPHLNLSSEIARRSEPPAPCLPIASGISPAFHSLRLPSTPHRTMQPRPGCEDGQTDRTSSSCA